MPSSSRGRDLPNHSANNNSSSASTVLESLLTPARAKELAEALPPPSLARLLELAASHTPSVPAFAAKFLETAARVHEREPASLPTWLDAFEVLQQAPSVARPGLEAFLEASKRRLQVATLCRWAEQARAIARHSPYLGSEYLVATRTLLGDPGGQAEALATLVSRFLHNEGPRGEFVVRALLRGLPSSRAKIDADVFALWATLGLRLEQPQRGWAFFAGAPPALWRLHREEQRLVLQALSAVTSNDLAWQLYCTLPNALLAFPRPLRQRMAAVLAASAPAAPAEWLDVVPVAAALLSSLPTSTRNAAVAAMEKVAAVFPAAVPGMVRRIPQIYECATEEQAARWVATGLELCGQDATLARAYFGLETRTSVRVLGASPTAAVFSEVQSWLRKFTHMLAATSVTLRPNPGWTLRPPLEGLFEERIAEVPDRIDFFPTHEENLGLYRFLAMQIAGRFACGTAPEAPAVWPRWKTELESDASRAHLPDWFLLAEGVRVGVQMAERFPGWSAQQRSLLARFCLRAREIDAGKQPSLPDWLLAWELAGEPLEVLPGPLQVAGAVVRTVSAPLRDPGATVDDSWNVAQLLEQAFRRLFASTAEPDCAPASEVPNYLVPVDLFDGDGPIPDSVPAETSCSGLDRDVSDFQAEITSSEEQAGSGTSLSADALEALMRAGVPIELRQGRSLSIEGLGLYINDLLGKLPQEQLVELQSLLDTEGEPAPRVRRWLANPANGDAYYYDEWDYLLNDYRPAWCRLVEMPVESDGGEFFQRTLAAYSALLPAVRREFQKIRPDAYEVVRGLEAGEDFDLNAVVDARSDRRARRAPSTKLYVARQREERDVAVLFLVDMSASTDEPVDGVGASRAAAGAASRNPRRIIDITKEALVIMAEALEELGDAYAIYGFSGHGRAQVEFYTVKSFREGLSAAVRGRIGALEPKRSTRMGTALRHALAKMAHVSARSRHILLLSDGFPQDFDYGQDRRSNTYGLRDTTAALRECEAKGVTPFCITVDRAGHDYLREMCPQSRYLVIDDITSLPRELPKIYQRVVTTSKLALPAASFANPHAVGRRSSRR